VRWDSPFVLATAGTLALHLLLLVGADAVVLTHPLHLDPPSPHVQLIDVKIVPHRDPPPIHRDEPKPVVKAEPVHARAAVRAAPVEAQPEQVTVPVAPPDPGPAPAEGGDGPVVAMDDLAPSATGVAVAKQAGGGGGRSGTGTGTGTGTGAGSGSGAPVSVATIKQLALPKADYGYMLSKDYPAEAKRLGIEGVIKVRLVVSADGKVTDARLLDHLGHGLDELALAQARGFEFTPARDGEDRAVASVVVWTFRMTPPK
jgi:TonB family protein